MSNDFKALMKISQFLPFDMNYETSFPLQEISFSTAYVTSFGHQAVDYFFDESNYLQESMLEVWPLSLFNLTSLQSGP